jgi:hypothetical protein
MLLPYRQQSAAHVQEIGAGYTAVIDGLVVLTIGYRVSR